MSKVSEQNFKAVEQALNTMYREINSMQERLTKHENTIAILQSELANQKQLTAHVLGRGMGSTVHGVN